MPNDPNDYYWFGSYWQMLVMLGLLVNMWVKKDCSGISLRSQVLYALVFTTRHQDLAMFYVPVGNIILKITYLIVTYGTVLSMLLYLQKTYEKQNDKTRIDIWVVACFLLGLFLVDRFDFLEVFTAFSIYLEAVAMIAQFQFIISTGRIDKHIILYIAAMGVYAILYVAYMGHQYRTRPIRYNYRIAAAVIQLLLYCDFFYQIYPLMSSQDNECESKMSSCGLMRKIQSLLCSKKAKDVEADIVDEEPPKTGHLSANVGNVVLNNSTLTGVHDDKEEVPVKEPIKK